MIPECHSAGSQLKPTANGNYLFCHCCTTTYLLHYPQSEHIYYQSQQNYQHNKGSKRRSNFSKHGCRICSRNINYRTHLILSDDSVATISVAPIHFLVLTTLPPNCSRPWRSNPFCHAFSISCCSF